MFALSEHLAAGLGLATFRPVERPAAARLDDLAGLTALHLLAAVACGAFFVEAPRVFWAGGLHGAVFSVALSAAFAYVAASAAGRPDRTLLLAVLVLSGELFLWPLAALLWVAQGSDPSQNPWLQTGLWWLLQLWWVVIAWRATVLALPWASTQAAALAALFVVASAGLEVVAPRTPFWYTDYASDEFAELYGEELVDAERVFHAQAELLDRATSGLDTGSNGSADLYLVAFAADSTQDVFLREVRYVEDLFERRFGTRGRSVVLANHASTAEELPLASLTNLRVVLSQIGTAMDADEDVLFLFLTGHGSAEHELSVSFPPLPLNTIDPEALAGALDESGVRNRVVVVSSCYSGGFVGALESEHSVVFTASAADRRSFGCSNEAEFTYFGEALFAGALERSLSIPAAFEEARGIVTRREIDEGKEPSLPQLVVGSEIVPRLAAVERALLGRDAGHRLARASEAESSGPR